MRTVPFPSLSEVMAWSSAYLDDAATHWNNAANVWEDAYSQTYRAAQRPVEPPRPAPEVTKLPPVRGAPLPGAPQFVPVPGVTAGHEPPVIGSLGQEPDLPETGVEP